jgi:hypothetical protein
MARLRRLYAVNHLHFITTSTYRRARLFDFDRFLEDPRERLGKFGLELHPDKTRRIEFGRYAESNRKQRGEGKPETFDLLGFTHISGKNRKGYFTVKRHTLAKRLRAKLQEIKQQLRRRRHAAVGRAGLLQLSRGTREPGQLGDLSDSVDPAVANATTTS